MCDDLIARPSSPVMIAGAVFLAAAAALLQPAAAQEPWEGALRRQLLDQERCEVNFLSRVREFELAGERVVEGRAHCADGRAFDVSRRGAGAPFTVKLCGPVEC